MALEGFPRISQSQRATFLASTIDILPGARGRSDLRSQLGTPLWVLMAGTLLLHLLASANVASLLLARGAARMHEIQTRMALGASRGRVTGLLLVDGLLVALAGGLVGLAVAPVVSTVLLSFLPRDAAGVDLTARIDRGVFGFALLASLATGVLCGLASAWQAGRLSLASGPCLRSSSPSCDSGCYY